ncbi:hypothetical protein LguiA_002591 [Lonicera macranthoides]
MGEVNLLLVFDAVMREANLSRWDYVMSMCDCARDNIIRDAKVDALFDMGFMRMETTEDIRALRRSVRTKRWFGVGAFIDADDFRSTTTRRSLSRLRRFAIAQRNYEHSRSIKYGRYRKWQADLRRVRAAARDLYSRPVITVHTVHDSNILCYFSLLYDWHGAVRVEAGDELSHRRIGDILFTNGLLAV